MLLEFHDKQNAKEPGSVHATYLLDGIPKPVTRACPINGHPRDGEDVHMQSSPFMSSAVQEEDKEEELAIPSRSVILAREEDLEPARSSLETVHSVHVYSLQPTTLQSLQTLSDCNRTVSATFNTEDPLVTGQQYGVIHNKGVRRRTARRPLGVAPSVAAVKKVEKTKPKASPKVQEDGGTGSKTGNSSSQEPTKKSEKAMLGKPLSKSSSKPPALKQEQSDIFKSFSKPKSTLKKETTDSSAVESPAPLSQESVRQEEDEQMKYDSDNDQEEDYVSENRANSKARSARSQRAEELRKMMEDDEEEVENTDKAATPDVSQDFAAIDEPSAHREPTPELAPVVSGGRRRGRRKVMKKKTIKDEEGYLVTKEEPAWESFSEDEPDSQKERAPVSSASLKGRKTGVAKPGQGNIMSFFGKK